MNNRDNAMRALVALVVLGILISFVLWFVVHQQRESDARWCALIVSLDDRYQSLPPSSDTNAKQLAASLHTLRDELRCPTSKGKP